MTPTFTHGFVINLARRSDRYASFTHILPSLNFPITRWNAIDGNALQLDAQLMGRIRPNLKTIPEPRLCRIIACALSHLELWKHISNLESGWYIIFEDDALLVSKTAGRLLNATVGHLPSDAQLVWLNEVVRFSYSALPYRVIRKLDAIFGLYPFRRYLIQMYRDALSKLLPPHFKRYSHRPITTEAYALTPATAHRLYQRCKDSLDAADVNIFLEARYNGVVAYECVPPIFSQNKQLASDIEDLLSPSVRATIYPAQDGDIVHPTPDAK